MSLFDFFFPEQAQASHLRRIANSSRSRSRRSRVARDPKSDRRFEELEEDVGYLALLLGAIVERLDSKGVVHRSELKGILAELDGIDGIADGRLDVGVLRGFQAAGGGNGGEDIDELEPLD